jgi:hypothetical protein
MTPPTHETPQSYRPRLPDQGRMRDLYERVAPILAIVGLLFAIVAVGWSWENQRATQTLTSQRTTDNATNQLVGCENANQSRAASKNLWDFVINLSLASNPTLTDEQRVFIGEFRAYVDAVYQPHDCKHLDKKYNLPSPPKIPTAG